MKQSSKDRIERLKKGCCPVHGLLMTQIDVWHKPKVGCPRRACLIYAKEYDDEVGPWELPKQFKDLLNDSSPDPQYIDADVTIEKQKKSLKKLKPHVWNKTHGYCYYCGTKITLDSMNIDHLIPEKKGGAHNLDNLFPACQTCNSSKGTKTLEEFRYSNKMKLFNKKHNITFSQEQYIFLKANGLDIKLPDYRFWFERMNTNNN